MDVLLVVFSADKTQIFKCMTLITPIDHNEDKKSFVDRLKTLFNTCTKHTDVGKDGVQADFP